ncbi:MAG TPA: hypothetical protein DCZ94_05150 [Lentisphaeria bacterium]|nr:MAG: hypothetical protein A2X48_07660 [Lentisphaerae bacterium GWF2_49_21]HBC86325.1 hypothetical protein [Lentisphaeria bacterium]
MSIRVKCGKCGQEYELEDSDAGQKAECQCGAEMIVPIPEIPQSVPDSIPLKSKPLSIKRQQPVEPPPPTAMEQGSVGDAAGMCPKCKNPVKSDAVICINCGHNLKLGVNVKTIAKAKVAGSFGLAVGVCAAAALLSGLVWAGIAIYMNLEIGWIAIGVGALTGFAATIFTDERSARLALAAALLAVVGLLTGKLITANYFFKEFIVKNISSNPAFLRSHVYQEAEAKKEIPAELADWLSKNDDDEVEVPANLKESYEKMYKMIDSRVAAMSKEGRDKAYKDEAGKLLGDVSLLTRIKAMLRAWDLLWFGLAIMAAWKIGSGSSQEG